MSSHKIELSTYSVPPIRFSIFSHCWRGMYYSSLILPYEKVIVLIPSWVSSFFLWRIKVVVSLFITHLNSFPLITLSLRSSGRFYQAFLTLILLLKGLVCSTVVRLVFTANQNPVFWLEIFFLVKYPTSAFLSWFFSYLLQKNTQKEKFSSSPMRLIIWRSLVAHTDA